MIVWKIHNYVCTNLGGAEDGHYVSHLNNGNQFFTINDNKPVTITRQVDLELSQIFLYAILWKSNYWINEFILGLKDWLKSLKMTLFWWLKHKPSYIISKNYLKGFIWIWLYIQFFLQHYESQQPEWYGNFIIIFELIYRNHNIDRRFPLVPPPNFSC